MFRTIQQTSILATLVCLALVVTLCTVGSPSFAQGDGTGGTEPSVAVNWLSASPEERVSIALAEPLMEVLNNPEAEIPPVQVTAWSVMDFSQMPEKWVEYYENYHHPKFDELAASGTPMQHTSVEWVVVPAEVSENFLNNTLPDFIQSIPNNEQLRLLNSDGQVMTMTSGEMKAKAPQVVIRTVGEAYLRQFPETVWNCF